MKKNNSMLVKRLSVTGMMIAIQIVLSRYLVISFPLMKIGFAFLPMVIIAMLYGPVYSGLAWGLADILGATLAPTGPFFFGFTVSAVLNGIIFGLFLYKNHTKVTRILLGVLLASTIVSIGCDTLWFTMMGSKNTVAVLISTRAIRSSIMAPIQVVTITAIGRLLGDFIYRNSAIFYEKKELRREALRYYKKEFKGEREKISESIVSKVLALDEYKKADTVFCYIGRDTEIDTSKIVEKALEDNKVIAVPLCSTKGIMTARKITNLRDLTTGSFGIQEPTEDSEIVPKETIDFAVIPTLLADMKGRRVGFGGGYYDRYLRKTPMFKVILAPKKMIKRRVPFSSYDIKADLVISD